MRISDWSSDVCSSDLDASLTLLNGHRVAFDAISQGIDISAIPLAAIERVDVITDGASALYGSDAVAGVARSAERRVGKECVSTCRSRWSPSHYKKNNKKNTTSTHELKKHN